MERLRGRRVVLLSAIAWGVLAAAAGWAQEAAEGGRLTYVSAEEVKTWLDEGKPVTVVDVREADEFRAGHLDGAINIPYEQIASIAEPLSKDQPLVLYCIHSAHRAPAASTTLRELGFTDLYVLDGGIIAWQEEGFAIRSRDLATIPTILPNTERCATAAKP
jgi:rhodanese-related sulfurtransferase